MRSSYYVLIITGFFLATSCVTTQKFSKVQDQLKQATQENEQLTKSLKRLETANTELESMNRLLTGRIQSRDKELEDALYDLNIQRQRNESLEKSIENINRQLESQKTGSTSEIELLLQELQSARNDLNMREDKLREAERTLEEKNARLVELQDVLAK